MAKMKDLSLIFEEIYVISSQKDEIPKLVPVYEKIVKELKKGGLYEMYLEWEEKANEQKRKTA